MKLKELKDGVGGSVRRFRNDKFFVMTRKRNKHSWSYTIIDRATKEVVKKDMGISFNAIKSKFSIDEDRMYLTGLSMGGGGTL